MKFQLATALLAGTAAAVPTWPHPHPHKTNWTAPAVPELDKRVVDPVSIAIIGGVVSGIVGVSGTAALNIAKDAIDWNAVSHNPYKSIPVLRLTFSLLRPVRLSLRPLSPR